MDLSLLGGQAELDKLGLPKPNTGMFASVYRMFCADGDWACRCFLHCVPDQAERYAAISAALAQCKLQNTVQFEWQDKGVFVRGRWFPILKMQWCEGETLDCWITGNLFNRDALNKFLRDWKELVRSFNDAGIAHGDFQHGNILVSNGQIKVVDYDCMFVPALKGKTSNELGHRDYQHPLRSKDDFSAWLDNFSAWVIYISVEILSHDPSLWHQLKGGEDCLLFRYKDFCDSLNSSTFMVLENHVNPEVRESARKLRYFTTLQAEEVPPLLARVTVPANLPELGAMRAALPGWFAEDEEDASPGAYTGDESAVLVDQGPAYNPKKRQRSRVKGGSQLVRTKSEIIDKPAEPVKLSPLACLARKVKAISAESEIKPSQDDETENSPVAAAGFSDAQVNMAPVVSLDQPAKLMHPVMDRALKLFSSRIAIALILLMVLATVLYFFTSAFNGL